MLRWYSHMLQTRPIITKMLSTGTIIGTGDVVSQLFDHYQETERQTFQWDHIRTARMFSWGLVMGPTLHGWYLVLERAFPAMAATATKKMRLVQAVKKLSTDQLTFAPLSIAVFLTYMGYMEGQDWEKETKPKIEKDLWPTLMMNYTIWPLVQLLNFSFVPLHHQVNLVNTVAIFWNAYLSKVQHREKTKSMGKNE